MKVIISGGGTGGHIFPAIAIANTLKEMVPDIEILFVGALGKLEMEKVPAAGYRIVGLPISGFNRSLTLKNLKVLFKLFKSLRLAKDVIKSFKPDIAVGVGGYASGPVLWAATGKRIPAVIQEQNSYAGVTNKLLGKRVKKVCVAYDNMEKFFPKEKIIFTGNPVRKDLLNTNISKSEAYEYFGLDSSKKTILVVGGSGGARTINKSILANVNLLKSSDIQVIWQTGRFYFAEAKAQIDNYKFAHVKVFDFITRMDYAYNVADLVLSRAGASSISELCVLKKPCILIPSPNVAEDHQTKNAMALVNNNAAILITDVDAPKKLIPEALELIKDEKKLAQFSENLSKMAVYDSAEKIAKEILNLVKVH